MAEEVAPWQAQNHQVKARELMRMVPGASWGQELCFSLGRYSLGLIPGLCSL